MCNLPSNTKSSSRKTWQASLSFLKPLYIQHLKRKKWGDMAYYIPPPEKVGGHVPCVPHQIAPMLWTMTKRSFVWPYVLLSCKKLPKLIHSLRFYFPSVALEESTALLLMLLGFEKVRKSKEGENKLRKTVENVLRCGSIRQAILYYNMPRTTLRRYITEASKKT